MQKEPSGITGDFIEFPRIGAEKSVAPENLIDVLITLQNLKYIHAFEINQMTIKVWPVDKTKIGLKYIMEDLL